jgi:hypothetical protein
VDIWNGLLMAFWAMLWLFIGFMTGIGYCRKRTPKCLHWWEIVSQPWTSEVLEGYEWRKKTSWHERCSACGELRTTGVWGTWTLKELTGEESLGVAMPTVQTAR